jgi:hypothetical protein
MPLYNHVSPHLVYAHSKQLYYTSDLSQLFLKRFIAQKIQRDTQGYKSVPLTNLPQLSFAEASDRVSTVLGTYKCSSEKQVQGEKHCGIWMNGYRRRFLGRLCMYFLYWR